MDAFLEWARGPAFRFAIAVLILGLLRHVVLTVLTVRTIMGNAGDKSLPKKAIRSATVSWLFPVRHLRHHVLFSMASVLFHVGVILAPLFLAGHVLLIERSIGISWPTVPTLVADILTVTAIAGLLVVFLVRVAEKTSRALSRGQDYAVLAIVALPFLSGFLAMHPHLNPFPFQITLLVHVLSGNLVLVLIPFTKLVHIVLMPATQLVSEVGWHFQPDAGERVARALGKENQAI